MLVVEYGVSYYYRFDPKLGTNFGALEHWNWKLFEFPSEYKLYNFDDEFLYFVV